ncbi:mitochondrial import inner membrane translocase subunit TIM14 isoform X1 [Rattus norvegicus]|uniref:mitochondrial import inner membrane translocase subunit TIM14 isoform X1 n=1 Tax=Rattus norvegicus TaxID=10116 RepID=UPI0000DA1F0A
MASPAPVRPFSQPQLLGPFLQHFVRQFRRTLRRPCRVARRCGSGGSAGSALSFYSSVLWRWARAGMSPRCRAAKWSHGQYSGSSRIDHCCCRICRPLCFTSHEACGASSKTSFSESTKICKTTFLLTVSEAWSFPVI